MKDSLKKYAIRYDFLFVTFGTAISGTLVYMKDWPVWAIFLVILAREFIGFMAMLSKDRE